MSNVYDILNLTIFTYNDYSLKLESILFLILIFILTKIILGFIKIAINRKIKKSTEYIGDYLAVFQLLKYFVWVIAIAFMFDALGINLTVLFAGSAALLVGIGMGLQKTFNDIISGVILLTEGTTRVGDILEIDNDIVTVQSIGLRTSKVINRDDIIVIVPNSIITTNKVINWTHQSKKNRFRINIGVSYNSDIDLVTKVLEESAKQHKDVIVKDSVVALLTNFGDSSLDFQLLFFSKQNFRIEKIKSDIRKIIAKKLKENNINIPFPQMDVHLNK